jgi:NADPH-dependent ferric siderophore reductase
MAAAGADRRLGQEKPGMVQKALRRVLMRQATVSTCENLGDRFRLITFEGPQLRGAEWIAGQKLQIAIGASFATRTYTPVEWDAVAGRTRILGYVHGDTPGSLWIRHAAVGDRRDLLGPRSSLDASRVSSPLVVFGDETSLGLAYALQSNAPGRRTSCRLEAGNVADVEPVLQRLEFSDAKLFGREESDSHLEQMEAELPSLADKGATFVLTGRAPAIQRFRQALHRLEIPSSRVMTKAYWSPGKCGLD